MPSAIYSEAFPRNYGHAFWRPDPLNRDTQPDYFAQGVDLGDVLLLTSDGGYQYLFNVCRPADDPVNAGLTYRGFEHLPLSPVPDILYRTEWEGAGSWVGGSRGKSVSWSVSATMPISPIPVEAACGYKTSNASTAFVYFPEGASGKELANRRCLKQWLEQNIHAIFEHVNGPKFGREASSIFIVTGCVKATETIVMASTNETEVCEAWFKLKVGGGGGLDVSYSTFHDIPSLPKRTPVTFDSNGDKNKNHCAFAKGLTCTLRRSPIRSRTTIKVAGLSKGGLWDDVTARSIRWPFPSFGSRSSSSSSGHSYPSSTSSSGESPTSDNESLELYNCPELVDSDDDSQYTSNEEDEIIINYSSTTTKDPWRELNERFLELHAEYDYAISDTDDLSRCGITDEMPLLNEHEILPDELLSEKLGTHLNDTVTQSLPLEPVMDLRSLNTDAQLSLPAACPTLANAVSCFRLDINIGLQLAPNPDIPRDSTIPAQIIVNHAIFLQTIPTSGNEDSWNIPVDSDIPRTVSPVTIHFFSQTNTNVTRVHGTASCNLGEGRDAGPFGVSPFNTLSGDIADLNQGSGVHQQAVSLTPDDHPHKPSYLNALGNSLMTRFERLCDITDLQQRIQFEQDAASLIPDDHPYKPSYLNNLGVYLKLRFDSLGDLTDLNQAIQVLQYGIFLTPDGHTQKPDRLNTLGSILISRFERLGDLADLNQAVHLQQNAVALTPASHPDSPSRLNNLGSALKRRFEQLGDLADLNQAVQVQRNVILRAPEDHYNKSSWLSNLGALLTLRFQISHDSADLDEAINVYSHAATSATGSPEHIFGAARRWLELAIDHIPTQAMKAAEVSNNMIPRLVWLGSALSDQHHRIIQVGCTARDTAATAVARGEIGRAVEWLGQGTSVVWSQLLQLRSPLDELQSEHPKLASKLQLLSSQLEGSTSVPASSDHALTNHPPAFNHHQAAHERDILLLEIRKQLGFDRFLLPRNLNQLLPAAENGPVVMLLASRISCDALIIRPGSSGVLRVPLKNFTLERAQALRELLQQARSNAVFGFEDVPSRLRIIFQPQDSSPVNVDCEVVMSVILKDLWERVVRPVLDALLTKIPMKPNTNALRIWWCPTGPFTYLPIHAAGIYDGENGPKLPDYVVSSYTPTLATLLRQSNSTVRKEPRLLTVALPSESLLPGTRREVESVVKLAKASDIEVEQLLEGQVTVSRVSQAMKVSNLAHFACHGRQNSFEPNESYLLLAGGSKLTLSDIIKLPLGDNAELAFLSACETATDVNKLKEDEAVYLAAGMLRAGYRGVIGTMWSSNDSFAPDVAAKTYELLFGRYGADATRAAEALHFAIKQIREEKEAKGQKVPFMHWVPFMHLGI